MKYDTSEERTIEREVAKPFRILSAYFITAATIRPPAACEGQHIMNVVEDAAIQIHKNYCKVECFEILISYNS